MKKPLIFRGQRYGGDMAQRDHIQYEIKYSHWVDGKDADCKYHVTRWDIKNKDHISTERVKRFATPEEAKQYCQDMYDGITDLSALRAEIKADTEKRERNSNQAARDGADKFKEALRDNGVDLSAFLALIKVWGDTSDTSRSMLYREAEEAANKDE